MRFLMVLLLCMLPLFAIADPQSGFWDTGNSTTKALDNGETFTGTAIPVSSYKSVTVAVLTDQSGTLKIQFSPDKSNWDSTLSYDVAANNNDVHQLEITRPYMRVTFTNDSGSDQTFLRMTTLIGEQGKLTSKLNSTVQQDSDATVVRPADFKYEVAQGRWQNHSMWNKFGYNNDIDTASGEEILAAWGGTFQYLTSGETLTIVSSSTSDTSAGVGARSIVIWGVDSNWDDVIEVVTLNGTTNVVTTSSWIGINRISIYLAGSSVSNVGNITVTATTSGYTLGYMAAGEGTSQQCIFYVSDNHTLLLDWLVLNAIKTGGGSKPEVTYKGWVFSQVSNAKYEVFRASIDVADETNVQYSPSQPFVIAKKSIFWLTGQTTADNTSVRCRFSGVRIKD